MNANITVNDIIDDRAAKILCDMADRFYSDPKNVKGFEAWYKKKHGHLPQTQGGKKNGRTK